MTEIIINGLNWLVIICFWIALAGVGAFLLSLSYFIFKDSRNR